MTGKGKERLSSLGTPYGRPVEWRRRRRWSWRASPRTHKVLAGDTADSSAWHRVFSQRRAKLSTQQNGGGKHNYISSTASACN